MKKADRFSISICLCIWYSVFGSSSPATKGKRRFYICVSAQRKIAVWVTKKPDKIGLFRGRHLFCLHSMVGAGGPELRSAFVCCANLRFINLWFESSLFCIKIITNRKAIGYYLVGAGGFEPPKSSTTDLQSAPFGHSGTLPHIYFVVQNTGAGGRT